MFYSIIKGQLNIEGTLRQGADGLVAGERVEPADHEAGVGGRRSQAGVAHEGIAQRRRRRGCQGGCT